MESEELQVYPNLLVTWICPNTMQKLGFSLFLYFEESNFLNPAAIGTAWCSEKGAL